MSLIAPRLLSKLTEASPSLGQMPQLPKPQLRIKELVPNPNSGKEIRGESLRMNVSHIFILT